MATLAARCDDRSDRRALRRISMRHRFTLVRPASPFHAGPTCVVVHGDSTCVAVHARTLTKLPERIALSHAFGGAAVALVGIAEYLHHATELGGFGLGAIGLEVLMGVIICLLNAYAGLAASASGFALDNQILVICGALDGGSGLILELQVGQGL